METVNLSLPSTEYLESDQIYLSSFWRWYEKLSSISEKYFIPDWMDKDSQDSDKWPFY
jgi:hypothetical protein